MLEQLAVRTGETAIFNEPSGSHLVVSQVAESQQALRMAPRIGALVPARDDSATGESRCPSSVPDRQVELLGEPPDAKFRALLDACRSAGYAASSEVNAPAMTIAAPVSRSAGGRSVVAISGPAERMPSDSHPRLAGVGAQRRRPGCRTARRRQEPDGNSEGGDVATVDTNVRAGDVRCVAAGEEQHEVGDLHRCGEAAGCRTCDHRADHIVRSGSAGRGELCGNALIGEPQIRCHGTGAHGVDTNTFGPELFETLLAKLASAALVAL